MIPDRISDDVIGSSYSIYEYTCNPVIWKNEDLIWLREQLNSQIWN